MANRSLFKSIPGKKLPKTDTLNFEGARAYALPPKAALAQYVATGCLNSTFYASADTQLQTLLTFARQAGPEFTARTAIYARETAFMKDAPAVLCAWLAAEAPDLFLVVFPRVIDNGRMLRNFVQVIRSGAVGRKSLGTRPRRLVREWLASRDVGTLFRSSVGQAPSLADVVKMVHPRPDSAERETLYAYLLGKEVAKERLPELVRSYEAFKTGESREVPDVPFEMLTSLELGRKEWAVIAGNASWQTTRMNLNTFARHGVFEVPHLAATIAGRLKNPNLVRRARAFPYQLLMAHASAGPDVPESVKDALQEAMEVAISNVPEIEGRVYVCPDVSGSMSSPVTGHRKGSTSMVRCIDVAALVAAAILRKNREARVLPFEAKVVDLRLEPRDTVMTNAKKLASIGGGGTNCSAPLALLNKNKAKGDIVIFVSDNQSWVDARNSGASRMMQEWNKFRQRNPKARLVCIDIQPYATSQAAEREDILNVGGFSDAVFSLTGEFAAGRMTADHWTGKIERIVL